MFFVPLAQNVDYKQDLMKGVELGSHFIGGIMLVTNRPTGAMEPLLTRISSDFVGRGPHPDHHQRQNHAAVG
jgi:hypothetical protein